MNSCNAADGCPSDLSSRPDPNHRLRVVVGPALRLESTAYQSRGQPEPAVD